MSKIEFDGKNGSGPLMFLDGANHYRFMGLEVTRGLSGATVSALALTEKDASADHIIFDRVWMHGTAQDETTRGIALRSITYAAVVDSFLDDFHCTAVTGACLDSQALGNGGGDHPGGPYRIENNFLEAAGENIMFGGGPGTISPADIEIRRNHLFKPMIWKKGESGFVGGDSGHPFIVKNHFELKNAQRVLFEDNVLENNWSGFTQTGYSILITPKNQNNRCPACQVTDVTLRYNKITNVEGVFQIANALSAKGGATTAGERYSIHDLLVQNIQGRCFAIVGSMAPPLRDVLIDHVTALAPRCLFSIFSPEQKIANFVVTNNVFAAGSEEIASAGGGRKNCAFNPRGQGPSGVLKSCFENITFTHNIIVGGSKDWPHGNATPKDAEAAGIQVVAEGANPGLRFCRSKGDPPSCSKPSPAIGAATDGKDIGANIRAIEERTAGVP